jgi:predicted transcriptional regulator of viral defense system
MTDTVERTERLRPRDVPDWLLSHGLAWATTADVSRLLDVPAVEVAAIAARWLANGHAFSPTPGAYVPIPSQYRTWGAAPARDFIDPFMKHLGHPYYVGCLSAAEVHGAAHQRPQVFQVVTSGRLTGRQFGRVRLAFITSASTASRPTVKVNTPTGTMIVSTPETTVLDLVANPRHGGGLSNIATVIGELLGDNKLDLERLAENAKLYTVSVAQRAGWMIEHTAAEINHHVDLADLAKLAGHGNKRTLLSASGPRRGATAQRWHVVVNADVESDL